MSADMLSSLPKLDYETAEKWLAGKAGVLQDAAEVALDAQSPISAEDYHAPSMEELREFMGEPEDEDDLELMRALASGGDYFKGEIATPVIRFCEGDLVADDLAITCDCLIVAGDLKVKGLMQTEMQVEEGALIVIGNAEVGRYISRGAHTVICGNLRADHISTNSLNDLSFSVGGNVKAESFAEFGEYVEIHGALEVGALVNVMNEINVHGERKADIIINRDNLTAKRSRFRVKIIGKDGLIDETAYNECLKNNISPFV